MVKMEQIVSYSHDMIKKVLIQISCVDLLWTL